MSRSGIESLPVELLQPIFFLSGHNVALLQASSLIAARLSSEYVYYPTCRRYLTEVMEDCTAASQRAAQTYIFASKWMTWAFFKSWVLKTYEANGCLCGMTYDEGCFDAQWPPKFEKATDMYFSRSHLPQLAFVRARIPVKLLRGPWTPEKIQFLRFLLWITSMSVDWHNEQVRTVAVQGRLEAIREHNLEAVELFNHNRRLGKPATLSMVEFAVVDCGCDRSTVYDTMAAGSMWSLTGSWESATLDEWCERRIEEGNPKGQWLKTKLEELRAPSRPEKVYQGVGLGYKSIPGGELDSAAGDYDAGPDDRLVVNRHRWNEVSFVFS